jgi:cell division protein FtsL
VFASLLLLVGAFFAAALVQAQLVQTQAETDRIQAETNRLENDLALLDRQVVEASSPEVIVARARRLGMVRAVRPVYLVATRPVGP